MAAYRLLPKGLTPLFAFSLPIVELVLGLCLFFPNLAPWSEIFAAALVFGFSIAIVLTLLRGVHNVPCGCCGGGGKGKKFLGAFLGYEAVLRNILLIGVAVVASGVPVVGKYAWRSTMVIAVLWMAMRLTTRWVQSAGHQGVSGAPNPTIFPETLLVGSSGHPMGACASLK